MNSIGFEAIHINNILDKWYTSDKDISEFADDHNYIVVTKDSDFRNSFIACHKPYKLIKINLGNISNTSLIEIFKTNIQKFEHINTKECFMIEIDAQQITVIY